MKSIRIIITATLFTISLLSNAQQISLTQTQWLDQHKRDINNVPYIVLGTVIKQSELKEHDNDLYMCSLVSIIEIFKGSPQVTLGTMKVFVPEGITVEPGGAQVETQDAGVITLTKGATYIFFCRQSYKYMDVDTTSPASNITKLTTMDCDYPIGVFGYYYKNGHPIIPPGNAIIKWEGNSFKTLSDVDNFFQENGIIIQEQIQQADSTQH